MIVCAATDFELAAASELTVAPLKRVVTGVGIPAVLGGDLARVGAGVRPDRILNIGIAGAYPDTGIEIGDIVLATGDCYGDIGFELPTTDRFQSIEDSPFGAFYREALLLQVPDEWWNSHPAGAAYTVHRAKGCTVNGCTGTLATGALRRDRFGAQFETMEGAAVAQVGQSLGVPVCQMRAISNIAADRDMRPENIRLALQNLRHYLETCCAAPAVQ